MDKPTILIAEDEADLQDALSTALQEAGYQVITTNNGEQCLSAMREQSPDLLVLDIKMPEVSGLEVLKELDASADQKAIPVIVLTNLEDMETLSQVMEHGVFEYLIKTENTLEQVKERIAAKLGD